MILQLGTACTTSSKQALATSAMVSAAPSDKELEQFLAAEKTDLFVNRLQNAGRKGYLNDSAISMWVAKAITRMELDFQTHIDKQEIIQAQIIIKNIKFLADKGYAHGSLQNMTQQLEALVVKKRALDVNLSLLDNTPNVPEKKSAESLLAASVTIQVDKGYKVERGFGFPDKVIGSGFFINPHGYVITNYHVIQTEVDSKYEGYSKLTIRIDEKTKLPAKVIAWDPVFDLALLKTEYDSTSYISVAGMNSLNAGSKVFAIGSPGGLEKTITTGIVSSASRRFLELGDALQVDVAINPGNSGGPLVDEEGRLVGIVYAGVEQFEGVNFAVSAKWLRHIIPSMALGGKHRHPWLGIQLYERHKELLISWVSPGSPADHMGLKVGDVLVKFGTVAAETELMVQEALVAMKPGELVAVTWKKGNGRLTERNSAITEQSSWIALAERPLLPLEAWAQHGFQESVMVPMFGFSLRSLSRNIFETAFVVDEVLTDSPADEAGLSTGDPLRMTGFGYQEEGELVWISMAVQKRKAGFIDANIVLSNYVTGNNFL